eukprot:CAMPEP_0172535470 /NCGR_PEP_ID=MMETSP1067-20121228/7465_1 /TAXON_ID=265564 ORGANISM="Thalassiosira punctigera, Strain Tpunct2005C2" /NCGR_SAMPLE_ID=MMETSP1067 /ASSEMBLY_ACC=CAM_ASM_000444 /LENGTH=166 /DNA_ID=CAMNT_0013320403 /DNA_START=8 /DNA_END=508 /DNA_ORIENTATION=+
MIMRPSTPAISLLLLLALACRPPATALSTSARQNPVTTRSTTIDRSRREAFSSVATAVVGGGAIAFLPATPRANAAEDNQVLSDEEMAARVARKMELLRSAKSNAGGPAGRATDIRSDVNPEAAANLRSRSAIENAKIAMEKQKEMKSRDQAQKREDLCEMLGRGC